MTDSTDQATLKVINMKIAAVRVESSIAATSSRDLSETVVKWQDDIKLFFESLQAGAIQFSTGDSSTYCPEGQTDLQSGGDNEDPYFKIDDSVM